MLKNCDEDYVEPDITRNFDTSDEWYNSEYILPPRAPRRLDNIDGDVYLKKLKVDPEIGAYSNGKDSKYKHRGHFLIFNQDTFHHDRKRRRVGTEHDLNKLKKIVHELGFEVKVYQDATRHKILEVLDRYSSHDMEECEMFGMAVMSHGQEFGTIKSYDRDMHISEFVDPIKYNVTLHGKPKLFFIQACRGHGFMDGWEIVDQRDDDTSSSDEGTIEVPDIPEHKKKWPVDADVLIHFAQSEGYTSTRNPQLGSTFIVGLCYFLKYAYLYELHDLLIRVNALVSHRETQTNDPRTDSKKQIPVLSSQLTKLLFLKPREGGNTDLRNVKYERDSVRVVNGVPMMVMPTYEELMASLGPRNPWF